MCHTYDENNEFRYLNAIIEALEDFYRQDYILLSPGRHTHEQTVSFRLAIYLAQRLEPVDKRFFVDCEYHGDIYNPERRKIVHGRNIRPDIIYHDRNWRNEFCIEMKIGSLTDGDYEKLNGLVSEYDYREAYGISNFGTRFVTVDVISPRYTEHGIRYQLRFNHEQQRMELRHRR